MVLIYNIVKETCQSVCVNACGAGEKIPHFNSFFIADETVACSYY